MYGELRPRDVELVKRSSKESKKFLAAFIATRFKNRRLDLFH